MDDSRPKTYSFGPFKFDPEQRLLFRAGDLVPLTPKAFDTLAVLVARQGRVIDKAELLRLVWPDTFVEENNLTQNISALRKVLGDDYIETIPRRGYRFLIQVEDLTASPAAPAAKSRVGWIWVGSAAALVLAVLGFYITDRIRHAGRPNQRVDSLVVLPFVNLTSDPENEYFSDGLTEELTNALAHLDGVRVVARTTAFQFKGKAQDVRSIAKQLNVSAVLEGSVRLEDKRLRVTVQLNDAQTGYHIWSQTYDRGEGDIFKMQEDISNRVAHIVGPNSDPVPAVIASQDLEAHNLYLLGTFHRRKPDAASERRAIEYFQQAIQKDPGYAAAYAGLAECYMALVQEGSMPPLEAWSLAQKATDKALALDENLAEAHTTQGIVHLLSDWNWPAAEQQFRRAIELNPNDATAHHWFSHYFLIMGRLPESLAESRRALELDPLDVQISGHLSYHYLRARDYSSAIAAGLQTLQLDSHAQLAFIFMTWAYEDSAQWDKAIDTSQFANEVHPEASVLRAAVQAGGPEGYWRARLAFLSKQRNPENYQVAVLQARLGEPEKALGSLELALKTRETNLTYVKREPAFDGMQSNPRFKKLTDALKLP